MPDKPDVINLSQRTLELEAVQKEELKDFHSFYIKWLEDRSCEDPRFSTRNIAKKLDLGYELFRKKVNGQKPIKKRDLAIAICMALELDVKATNEALRLLAMNELKTDIPYSIGEYEHGIIMADRRDRELVGFLNGHFSSINGVNAKLGQNNLPLLDLNDSRKHKKQEEQKSCLTVVKKMIYCNTDYLIYRDDRSLEREYAPERYNIGAEMWVEDTTTRERFHLMLGENNTGSIAQFSDGKYEWPRRKYDGEERFQSCFTDLQHMADSERARMMAVADDTKNYKNRTSAKLINGEMHIFHESFNTSVPEWNEYFWTEYYNGHYYFSVQNRSVFLWFHLGNEKYEKLIGPSPTPSELIYSSIPEMEDELQKRQSPIFDTDRYILGIQIRAFEQGIAAINRLLKKLRSKDEFIRDLRSLDPSPLTALEFFDALELFDCSCDEDYYITPGKQYADILVGNKQAVTLAIDDVLRGFELGFNTIEEIAESKLKNGSLENILK